MIKQIAGYSASVKTCPEVTHCFSSKRYSTNFYTGRLHPEVQPLTLLETIFHEKGTPLVYPLLTNGTDFTYLV